MSESAQHATGGTPHASPRGRALVDQILRDKNVQPVQSADDLACDDLFETDEELTEFLDYTYTERRANLV